MDIKDGKIMCIGHDDNLTLPLTYIELQQLSIREIVDRDVTVYDGVYRVFLEKYSNSTSPIYTRTWSSQYA